MVIRKKVTDKQDVSVHKFALQSMEHGPNFLPNTNKGIRKEFVMQYNLSRLYYWPRY